MSSIGRGPGFRKLPGTRCPMIFSWLLLDRRMRIFIYLTNRCWREIDCMVCIYPHVLWNIVPDVELLTTVVHISWFSLDHPIQIAFYKLCLIKHGNMFMATKSLHIKPQSFTEITAQNGKENFHLAKLWFRFTTLSPKYKCKRDLSLCRCPHTTGWKKGKKS